MKKLVILVFNVLLLFSLCGCSSTVYTVEEDGKTYEVNHETNTIYDGKYTYEFTYSGNSSSYHIDITYPNGATYTESCEDGSGLVGGSEGYDEEGYESPSQLCYLIMHKESLEIPASKIWGVVFFWGVGIFAIIAPRKSWAMQRGWLYKNLEPSDMAMGFTVLCGIVSIIVGIVIIFI